MGVKITISVRPKDHEAHFIFPTEITQKRVQDNRIITITTSQLQICSTYLDKWGQNIGIPSGPMSQRLSKLIALSFQDIDCFHPTNYCKPTWLVGKITIFTRIDLYLYLYLYIYIYNVCLYIYIYLYWIYPPPHPGIPVTTMINPLYQSPQWHIFRLGNSPTSQNQESLRHRA